MIGEKQKLSLYCHTHWDREWYWAFERYRTVLVTAMKLAVEAVENGDLPNFHLDGQVCALDDFLEVEPGYEARIKKLSKQNKLAIGPWYVLADQMLVGGESLIRNLEVGIARTKRYGKPMMVGYSPDTFGHSADLPRILKGFGIENAIVWRGVPELDQGPEFIWRSPDGSEVVALCLAKGYYQTLFHDVDGSLAPEKIDSIVSILLQWMDLKLDKERDTIVQNGDDSPVYSRLTQGCLVPVGGDHINPPKNLAKVIDAVDKRFKQLLKNSRASDDAEIQLESIQLPDYMSMVAQLVQSPTTLARLIEGELRENSAARLHASGYMLPGVLSTRLYLKRENRVLEHRLSRIAEPVYSMMTLAGITSYPALELDNAWKYMLKNHPHDSMCGCSVDDVHREMMTRFASIHHILDMLDERIREDLLIPGAHEWSHEKSKKAQTGKAQTLENMGFGRSFSDLADPDAPLKNLAVFNLSTEETSAPVKLSLAIPSRYIAVEERTASNDKVTKAATEYLTELVGDTSAFQIESVGFETELFGELGGPPQYKDLHYVRCQIWAANSLPLGVTKLEFKQAFDAAHPAVSASGTTISNGILEVHVSDSGDLSVHVLLDGHKQIYPIRHGFSDVADAGDSYNFDPVDNDQSISAQFKSCKSNQTGPLVGSLTLTYVISIPEEIVENPDGVTWDDSLDGSKDLTCFKRSDKLIEHEIQTVVSLKRGAPLVFFDTTWDNKSTDHRLEVVFDTGSSVERTWSENHYSLVERDIGYDVVELPVIKWTETPLDRMPCQRFFVANGQVFFNLGLPEYGVDGHNVSSTILRAVSMLSRRRLMARGGGAGPYMPTPEANSIGLNKVSYGWAPLAVSSNGGVTQLTSAQRALAYRLAERFEGNLWTTPVTTGGADALKSGSIFQVDNENIRCVAMYSNDGGASVLVRLLNVSEEVQTVHVTVSVPHSKVERVNLAGKKSGTVAELDGRYKLRCGVNELLTLRISGTN